jgi:hypothetical protein
MKMIIDHAHAVPPRPHTRTEQPIPADLEQVIMECLAKDPADRPPGAAELAERLAACKLARPWTRDRAAAWWRAHVPERQAPRPVADVLLSREGLPDWRPRAPPATGAADLGFSPTQERGILACFSRGDNADSARNTFARGCGRRVAAVRRRCVRSRAQHGVEAAVGGPDRLRRWSDPARGAVRHAGEEGDPLGPEVLIYLKDVEDVEIKNCKISGGERALLVVRGGHHRLVANQLDAHGTAIELWASSHNLVSDNVITFGGEGMMVRGDSDHNRVLRTSSASTPRRTTAASASARSRHQTRRSPTSSSTASSPRS